MQTYKRYKVPRTRKLWTDNDLMYAMDLHDAGTSTDEIARLMNRSPDSVRFKMIRMRKMKVRIDNSDLSLIDISNTFGFGTKHLRLYISKKKLQAYKIGGTYYVTQDNLEHWFMNGMADEIVKRQYKVTAQGMTILEKYLGSEKWLVTTRQVLELFEIPKHRLSYWMKHKNFPRPAIVLPLRYYKYNKQEVIDWAWHNAKVIITDEQFNRDGI